MAISAPASDWSSGGCRGKEAPITRQTQTLPFSLHFLNRLRSLSCRHNDLPWNIRKFVHNELDKVNFTHNLKYVAPWSQSKWSHTDITRLADGMVGCQVGPRSPAGLILHHKI